MWTFVTFSQCCVKCYVNLVLGWGESIVPLRSLPCRKFWSRGSCLVLVALHCPQVLPWEASAGPHAPDSWICPRIVVGLEGVLAFG